MCKDNYANLKTMSGRGDNNKAGSAGRGASNQSNQGFGQSADRGKSYHGEQTGGKPLYLRKRGMNNLPIETQV